MVELATSAHVLVVIEYRGTDCLLRPVLAYDVVINSPLEIPRVELRHAKSGFVEHGPAARVEGWVIASREARVEVCVPSRSREAGRGREVGSVGAGCRCGEGSVTKGVGC